MQGDFLRDLGALGVTARLKRLSDTLTADIKELYRSQGSDLEPSWHLIFLFLRERDATPTEIATSLRMTQPAVTAMVQRLVACGYLDVVADERDGRRRVVRLSALARRRLPKLERIWRAGAAAVQDIIDANGSLLDDLDALEATLQSDGFLARAQKRMRNGRRQRASRGARRSR